MAISFASGRYTTSSQTVTKQTDTKHEDQETHTITHTVVVQQPNGPTTTTTVQETNTSDKQIDKSVSSQTVTPSKKLNVSLLASVSGQHLGDPPAYGVSVSKEIIGPVTAGVWGMSNGTLGVSIGLNF